MIDINKQYRTRDGREVRIYAVDGGGEYSVHAAYKVNGKWLGNQWTACGGYDAEVDEHQFDLIEVKPRIKRKIWVNVYRDYASTVYATRDDADGWDRIACVEIDIDVEEGHGL